MQRAAFPRRWATITKTLSFTQNVAAWSTSGWLLNKGNVPMPCRLSHPSFRDEAPHKENDDGPNDGADESSSFSR